jgi:hypothetical protein
MEDHHRWWLTDETGHIPNGFQEHISNFGRVSTVGDSYGQFYPAQLGAGVVCDRVREYVRIGDDHDQPIKRAHFGCTQIDAQDRTTVAIHFDGIAHIEGLLDQ